MVTLVDVGEGGSSCLQTMMLVFECLHQDMYNVDAHRAQLFLATFFAGHPTAWSLQASSIHELNLYINPPVHLPGEVVHWHPSPFCSILTLKTKEWPLELRKNP